MFKECDKDGSGTLSRDEVIEAMKKFRGNYSQNQVLELLKLVDKNNDHVININGKCFIGKLFIRYENTKKYFLP